jgi:hypothetical protein
MKLLTALRLGIAAENIFFTPEEYQLLSEVAVFFLILIQRLKEGKLRFKPEYHDQRTH